MYTLVNQKGEQLSSRKKLSRDQIDKITIPFQNESVQAVLKTCIQSEIDYKQTPPAESHEPRFKVVENFDDD